MPNCLRIVFVTWEYAYIFWGGGGANFFSGGFSEGRIFHGKGEFQGMDFLGEILHRGTSMSGFPYEMFLVSCFLFADSILRVEMLRAIVRNKFSTRLNCLENISVARRGFPWRRSQIFWHYLKNDQELNKKQVFQLKVRGKIKTKRHYYANERGCSS